MVCAKNYETTSVKTLASFYRAMHFSAKRGIAIGQTMVIVT